MSPVVKVQDIPKIKEHMLKVRKTMVEENSPEDLVTMSHIFSHLVEQVEENGPMREMWMFSFEDYFGVLKNKIKTRSYPVSSIMKALELQTLVDKIRGLYEHHFRSSPSTHTFPRTREKVCLLDWQESNKVKGKAECMQENDLNKFHTWLREYHSDYMDIYNKFEGSLMTWKRYFASTQYYKCVVTISYIAGYSMVTMW